MKKFLFIGFALLLTGVFFKMNSSDFSHERSPSSQEHKVIGKIFSQIHEIQDVSHVQPVLTKIKTQLSEQDQNELSQSLIASIDIVLELKGLIKQMDPILTSNKVMANATTQWLKQLRQSIPSQSKFLHAILDFTLLHDTSRTFNSVSELQDFGITKIIPKYNILNTRLSEVLAKYPANEEAVNLFTLDLSALASDYSKFLPQSYREMPITSAHFYALRTQLRLGASELYYFSSYDFNQAPDILASSISKSIRKAATQNLFKKTQLNPASSSLKEQFINELNRKKYKDFATLRPIAIKNNFLVHSQKQYISYLESYIQTANAVSELRQSKSFTNFQERLFNEYDRKGVVMANETMQALKNQSATIIVSPLNHQTFKANLHTLFDASKVSDLKSFVPTAFDKNKEVSTTSGKIINLNYGKPLAWNDPSFSGLIPQTSNAEVELKTNTLLLHTGATPAGTWLKLFQ